MMMDQEQTTSLATSRWLDDRQRKGNWFDIAKNDDIPPDLAERWFPILQAFQVAFAPEIRRRLSSGQLDDKFVLRHAQWILPVQDKPTVRLNDQVRVEVLFPTNRPIQEGEPVPSSDLWQLVSIDLEEDELDAGHLTLSWTGDGWIAGFDFRAGRANCLRMLGNAAEFLELARFAIDQGYARACVDSLFSACEIVSKARLSLHRSPAAKAKKHGFVSSAINDWGRLGNVSREFVKLFNRTSSARPAARYVAASHVEMPSQSDLQIVRSEIEDLMKQVVQHYLAVEEIRGRFRNSGERVNFCVARIQECG